MCKCDEYWYTVLKWSEQITVYFVYVVDTGGMQVVDMIRNIYAYSTMLPSASYNNSEKCEQIIKQVIDYIIKIGIFTFSVPRSIILAMFGLQPPHIMLSFPSHCAL